MEHAGKMGSILVRCPHPQPGKDDIFGNEGVMETFRFHLQLIIAILRETGFYTHKRKPFFIFNVKCLFTVDFISCI